MILGRQTANHLAQSYLVSGWVDGCCLIYTSKIGTLRESVEEEGSLQIGATLFHSGKTRSNTSDGVNRIVPPSTPAPTYPER